MIANENKKVPIITIEFKSIIELEKTCRNYTKYGTKNMFVYINSLKENCLFY